MAEFVSKFQRLNPASGHVFAPMYGIAAMHPPAVPLVPCDTGRIARLSGALLKSCPLAMRENGLSERPEPVGQSGWISSLPSPSPFLKAATFVGFQSAAAVDQ